MLKRVIPYGRLMGAIRAGATGLHAGTSGSPLSLTVSDRERLLAP